MKKVIMGIDDDTAENKYSQMKDTEKDLMTAKTFDKAAKHAKEKLNLSIEKYHYQKEAVIKSLDECELANQIMHTAFINCNWNESKAVIQNYLGEYAGENPAEFIAEAFSSTYDNLVNEVKRLLSKKWGIKDANDYAAQRNP